MPWHLLPRDSPYRGNSCSTHKSVLTSRPSPAAAMHHMQLRHAPRTHIMHAGAVRRAFVSARERRAGCSSGVGPSERVL